jgi:hypothetical protein
VHRAHRLLPESTRILCTLRSRPREGGWKVLKRRALSLLFLRKIRQSTMRTTAIAFAPVRIAFLIQGAISNAPLRSTRRIENCDAVIRVYDEAGNVIETHEQAASSNSGSTIMFAGLSGPAWLCSEVRALARAKRPNPIGWRFGYYYFINTRRLVPSSYSSFDYSFAVHQLNRRCAQPLLSRFLSPNRKKKPL